jgi:hypothetical protein
MDLDDEEWVDPTPIPPSSLELTPPAFPRPPPVIAKTKSSGSIRVVNAMKPCAHIPFQSSVAEGAHEDRPRRIPQMSTARGSDGARRRAVVLRALLRLILG